MILSHHVVVFVLSNVLAFLPFQTLVSVIPQVRILTLDEH